MVRIWCVPVRILGTKRLSGEHCELHVIWNALLRRSKGIKAGWQNHPQTRRFYDKPGMLIDRHEQQVEEMNERNWNHNSPLPEIYGAEIEIYTYSQSQYFEDLMLLKERNGFIEGLKIVEKYKVCF